MSVLEPVGVRLLTSTSRQLRALLVVAALLAVGAAFSALNVNLVRSAEAAITVAMIDQPVPSNDPFSKLWEQSPLSEIPLSAQQMWQPGGGSVQGVQVRALQDGENMAVLVSWEDDTKNDFVVDLPSDAAAMQLPMTPTSLPYQCMGQANNPVNIWQWKAALEANAKASEGAIPYNGTRNLLSYGMGKVAEVEGMQPVASSVWQDGRWYLIFTRQLGGGEQNHAPLAPGVTTNAAFAVWNGAKGETRAMKAVSTWTPMTIQAGKADPTGNYLIMAVAALLAAGVVVLGFRFLPR